MVVVSNVIQIGATKKLSADSKIFVDQQVPEQPNQKKNSKPAVNCCRCECELSSRNKVHIFFSSYFSEYLRSYAAIM